jgi:hypothetical protein
MNWWPWQPKQAPARTAANTGVSETHCYDNRACGETLAHGTYGGMNHTDLDRYLSGQAQAEHLRKPGPDDIEWYRGRARTAEAEARKLRLALYEILGEVPGWKVEVSARDCFDAIDDIALTVLGHPTKSEAGYAEDRLRRAK